MFGYCYYVFFETIGKKHSILVSVIISLETSFDEKIGNGSERLYV